MTSPLPPGLVLRATRPEDAPDVARLLLARREADGGPYDLTLEGVRFGWQAPGITLERDAWVVEDPEGVPSGHRHGEIPPLEPTVRPRIVASALLRGVDALVAVHPERTGEGLGALLLDRVEVRAREKGVRVLRQFVPAGDEVAAPLLVDAGWRLEQHYLRMGLDLAEEREPPPPARPDTEPTTLRRFRPDRDAEAVHTLVQLSFRELEGIVPQSFESWSARLARPSFDPALWLVLEDSAGPVGVVLGERRANGIGYVDKLAVAARARRRGHGRTLLLAAFGVFRRAGLRRAELTVHGANGRAASLYESVGMRPVWRAERWEKPLVRT